MRSVDLEEEKDLTWSLRRRSQKLERQDTNEYIGLLVEEIKEVSKGVLIEEPIMEGPTK